MKTITALLILSISTVSFFGCAPKDGKLMPSRPSYAGLWMKPDGQEFYSATQATSPEKACDVYRKGRMISLPSILKITSDGRVHECYYSGPTNFRCVVLAGASVDLVSGLLTVTKPKGCRVQLKADAENFAPISPTLAVKSALSGFESPKQA